MQQLDIATKQRRQVIDITEQVAGKLPQGSGVVVVLAQHTTAAITTADLDPGTDLDLLDFLDSLVPDKKWRHPHDPSHAPDHFLASLIGPSVSVPFQDGQLQLGTWQRIVLIELDGPRQRNVTISVFSD